MYTAISASDAAADSQVIDFSGRPLQIYTGYGNSLALSMNGAQLGDGGPLVAERGEHEGLHAPLKHAAFQHHTASAGGAFDTNIRAQPDHEPGVAPTGVHLPQPEDVS